MEGSLEVEGLYASGCRFLKHFDEELEPNPDPQQCER
jgi:hypothetical protein